MFFADLHVHSKFSRATSQDMNLESLSAWSQIKGINLITTGDFTHPVWFKELEKKLEPAEPGLYTLKKKFQPWQVKNIPTNFTFNQSPRFILTTELSSIYSKHGNTYRIHNVVFAPSLEIVEKINAHLGWEFNLKSDGRPILGLDAKELVKRILDISPECFIVPAHIWTPWFSLFGARSGFDRLEECFEEYAPKIFAAETGLSSDPAMNWRVSALDRITLISNSDSHSPRKIGREANVFAQTLDYYSLKKTLEKKDAQNFLYTIEFFPEEGKYHYDGHSRCQVSFKPQESKARNNICPVCGQTLTIGVLHRVDDLADRPEGAQPKTLIPFKNLIPLEEIIADALEMGVGSRAVAERYFALIRAFGNEFNILLNATGEELAQATQPEIAQAVINMRQGKVEIKPGYDGIYGIIKIKKHNLKIKKQEALF